MSRETSNLGLILYDPSEDKDVKVRDLINKVLGFTDSNTIKIDAKTKDIDTNIKTLHDSIIGTDGNVVFYNKQEVFLAVHPVGSIFLSTDGTEPAELYGGTWEQIKDVFLLGASDTYPAGSTGGEAEHSHEYAVTYASNYNGIVGGSNDYSVMAYNGTTGGGNIVASNAGTGIGHQYSGVSTTVNQTLYYKRSLGKTGYGSSIPPYYSVYIWRRVA